MEGLGRTLAAALAVACSIVTASGCGDEPDAGEQVVVTLREIQDDFDAGRVGSVCAAVRRPARCRTVARFLRDRAVPLRESGPATAKDVIGVRVRGDLAVARVTLDKQVDGLLRFLREGGDWKLEGLRVRPDLERSRWKPTPARLEGPPSERPSLACPPIAQIRHEGRHTVSGGCDVRFANAHTRLVMATAVGDFEIARCSLDFTVHVASNTTAIVADDIGFRGGGLCARTRRCPDGETGLRYPWQGDFPRGSLATGMHLRFDICVNTPLGRARGMWHYRLERRASGVVARSYDHPIGESAIRLLGTWAAEPDDFLDERAAPGG